MRSKNAEKYALGFNLEPTPFLSDLKMANAHRFLHPDASVQLLQHIYDSLQKKIFH